MKYLSFIFVFSLLITSCSVEKRLYMPGYSIRKNVSNKNNDSNRFVKHETETLQTNKDIFFQNKNQEMPVQTASVVENTIEKSNYSYIADTTKSGLELFSILNSVVDSCDEITMKNDSVVKAKIIAIDIDKISYKRCDYQTGPTITINKSDVKAIKYANGVIEKITYKKDASQEALIISEINRSRTLGKVILAFIIVITLAIILIAKPFK